MFLKLATNDRSDKMFLLTSKFHPQGVVSPCPGAIYMYKIMKKNCIKSDFKEIWKKKKKKKEIFLKLVANDGSDQRFLLTSKFCPLGLSACRPHSLNIFSSETTGPIEAKFHVESPWDGGTKVCSNGPDHMTKMAAMPIYGKNLKKSSSLEPKGWCPWNLVCSIGYSSTTKFVQMMTQGWPWPILQQGQIWSLVLFYGKKVKQWIFQKLLSSMIWN